MIGVVNMYINPPKAKSIPEMIMLLYWDNDTVSEKRLTEKVDKEVIASALKDNVLRRERTKDGTIYYHITSEGEKYRK